MSGIKAKAQNIFESFTSGEPVLNFHKAASADTLWPNTIDKEADKASHILRSFFVDGFIVPYRTIGFCPREILKGSCGLAVFHILRNGLASSTASGSGILVAKGPDGQWSPPAGILIDAAPDLPPEVDVLDVVLVIKDSNALGAFTTGKVVLGNTISIAPGPVPESEAGDHGVSKHDENAAVWTYAKSRGHLIDFSLNGTGVREAAEENVRFYGVQDVKMAHILGAHVKAPNGRDHYLAHTLEALVQDGDEYGKLPKAGRSPGDQRVKEATA